MSKRLLTMLAGVAAFAMLVAGCGDGGDEESLTKAEYAEQGTVICKETVKDMGAALDELAKREKKEKGRPRKELATEFVEDSMLPAYESQLEELRDMPAPSADEAQLNAIYAEMQQGIDEVDEKTPKVFLLTNKKLTQGKKKAEDYGLKECMAILPSSFGA
jgi:hypothetical protein